MAHTLGRQGDILIGGTVVGGVVSLTSNIAHDHADSTDFDSAGWKEKMYDESEVTWSVECLRDEADTGQDNLRTAATGKTAVTLDYRPYNNAGADQYELTTNAFVSSHEVTNTRGEVVKDKYDLVSSGAVTFGTI